MVVAVHESLAGGPVGKDSLSGLASELAFSAEEYEDRVDGVRRAMNEANVDVLLVSHPPNVYYLSGYQSFAMYNGECVISSAGGAADSRSAPAGAWDGPASHLAGRGARLPQGLRARGVRGEGARRTGAGRAANRRREGPCGHERGLAGAARERPARRRGGGRVGHRL